MGRGGVGLVGVTVNVSNIFDESHEVKVARHIDSCANIKNIHLTPIVAKRPAAQEFYVIQLLLFKIDLLETLSSPLYRNL